MRAWASLVRAGRSERSLGALDASEGAISRWLAGASSGKEALRSHRAPGRVPKLADEQLRMVLDFLWHGAEAYGFRGDVWTCERVAGVIYQEFGVRTARARCRACSSSWDGPRRSPSPGRSSGTRRRSSVAGRVWPALKEEAGRSTGAWFSWMNRGSTCCPVWSRLTPRRDGPGCGRVADAGPPVGDGRRDDRGQGHSLVRPRSLNGWHSIAFLLHLGRLVGDRLLVIWDGIADPPAGRGAGVRAAEPAEVRLERVAGLRAGPQPGGMAVAAPEGGRAGAT